MKEALKVAQEIIDNKKAIKLSHSDRFIRDRKKRVIALKKDLMMYCCYKRLSYQEIMKEAKKIDKEKTKQNDEY